MISATSVEKEWVVASGRRRRRDLGSVRFSERDGELLGVVGEQYSVTVEQLAFLIGRSFRTGRWLRDRWLGAGWVESRQLVVCGPSFLWLTAEGVRVACSPYRRWRPNPALAVHIEAVTDVRLLLERLLGLGEWECERSLAKTAWSRSEQRQHLPDAVLDTGRGRIAVEVELTLKSRARLDLIVAELAQRYSQVWYFAAPGVAGALTRITAETKWLNVSVLSFPPDPAEVPR